MSENVALALIVLVGQAITGLFMWLSNRALTAKVEVIHKQTNSMHLKLMAEEYKRGGADERANPSGPE